MRFLIRLGINAVALWVAATVLPDLTIEEGVGNLLIVAGVFGLVNALIRPVAKLLSIPLRVATLGLFTLVINGLMVIITSWIVDLMTIEGRFLASLFTAIAAALIISVVSMVLSWVLPDDRKKE